MGRQSFSSSIMEGMGLEEAGKEKESGKKGTRNRRDSWAHLQIFNSPKILKTTDKLSQLGLGFKNTIPPKKKHGTYLTVAFRHLGFLHTGPVKPFIPPISRSINCQQLADCGYKYVQPLHGQFELTLAADGTNCIYSAIRQPCEVKQFSRGHEVNTFKPRKDISFFFQTINIIVNAYYLRKKDVR